MNAACTFSHRVDPRVLSHGPPFPYKALQGLHSALLVARIMLHHKYRQTDRPHFGTAGPGGGGGGDSEEGTQGRGEQRREEKGPRGEP